MQTGLIMLIGLLAKTAILLTEYASERRRVGMSIAAAALSAATVRLRPILMTALTMIIGLLLLWLSLPEPEQTVTFHWEGNGRRYAYRNDSPAIRRPRTVYRIPAHRRTRNAQAEAIRQRLF